MLLCCSAYFWDLASAVRSAATAAEAAAVTAVGDAAVAAAGIADGDAGRKEVKRGGSAALYIEPSEGVSL